MNASRLSRLCAISILMLALGGVVSACPVCFNPSEASSATQGLNLAIFTLLGITGGVLSGVVAFVIQMRRRLRRTEKNEKISDISTT